MTTVYSLRSLTRSQREKLGRADADVVAEELAAEEFSLVHRPNEKFWYDVRAPSRASRPTKGEVKSAHRRVGEDYPAAGRFRVRRDQHRSLTASDAQGTAWYIFVLFDEEAGEVVVQRRRPSTVRKIVEERGGWNDAGHEEFAYQHKLPIEEVLG